MAVTDHRPDRWAAHLPATQLRFARPQSRLDAVVHFCRDCKRDVDPPVNPCKGGRPWRADPLSERGSRRGAGRVSGVRRAVFAVAYKTLGSRDLAEEATQQTFLKAWRAAATFDPARELGPWLATIARRTAIDLYRREACRPTERLDDAVVAELPGRHGPDLRCVGRARGDRRAATARAGGRTAPAPRVVDAGARSVARLGVPVGTIKSRSFRAHRRLAARLGHLRRVGT